MVGLDKLHRKPQRIRPERQARNEHAHARRNDSRIRYLQRMVDTAKVISDHSSGDVVGLFDKVVIYIPDDDEEQTIRLVTTLRQNARSRASSARSPRRHDRFEPLLNDPKLMFFGAAAQFRHFLHLQPCSPFWASPSGCGGHPASSALVAQTAIFMANFTNPTIWARDRQMRRIRLWRSCRLCSRLSSAR